MAFWPQTSSFSFEQDFSLVDESMNLLQHTWDLYFLKKSIEKFHSFIMLIIPYTLENKMTSNIRQENRK